MAKALYHEVRAKSHCGICLLGIPGRLLGLIVVEEQLVLVFMDDVQIVEESD